MFLDDERMVLEEREDALLQPCQPINRVRQHAAVRSLGRDAPTTEEADKSFEHRSMPLVLVDLEDGQQLPPARRPAHRVAMHRDAEAPFAVGEADDPLLETRPFLLIVRTGWVVTAHPSPLFIARPS